MELYTLDGLLRRNAVVDRFESMIWTERYSEWGDFELQLFSTPELRRLLPAGTFFSMSHSYRVMITELVEDSTDSEGRSILKLSGRSIEAILADRTARNSFANLATLPKWKLSGTPGNIAREIFDKICRNNTLFEDDNIPFLKPGALFPPGTIAEPDEVIEVELGLGTVYDAIKQICDAYGLGFRLIRNLDNSGLYFDIYSGNDRTSKQSINDPVVFAPDLDNLTNISSITSIGNYKNVAYVFHPNAVQIVSSDEVPVEVEGFDRRVLTVNASDIEVEPFTYTITAEQRAAIDAAEAVPNTQPGDEAFRKLAAKGLLTEDEIARINFFITSPGLILPDQKTRLQEVLNQYTAAAAPVIPLLNAALVQRGRDELAKHRQVSAFDGELPMNSPYPYDIAYQLGDLVEMRNIDGVSNQMRVTEQIFVSNAQGERSYPTLSMNMFVAPDTWLGWDYNDVWETADPVWADA